MKRWFCKSGETMQLILVKEKIKPIFTRTKRTITCLMRKLGYVFCPERVSTKKSEGELMSVTPSNMLPLGTKAPHFSLPDTNGKQVSLEEFEGKPLLVVFMCNHCPYVQHIADELARFAREYQRRGLATVGINANDARQHPEDSPGNMVAEVQIRGYTFPYLYDESQEVAKEYRAACTPDFFLFDAAHRLAYRGQFDDSRPNNGKPDGKDLRAAADAVLAGEEVNVEQKPSMGCNIKWRQGNEPDYAQ